MASNLALRNSAFSTGLFGSAISAGYGQAAPLPSAAAYTIVARVKTTASGSLNLFSAQSGVYWLGHDASGNVQAHYGYAINGTGNEQNIATSVKINDGAWHEVELRFGPSGGALYVDGTLASSNAVTFAAATPNFSTATSLDVACFNSDNYPIGGNEPFFKWSGLLDEVAVFASELHTANYTVPTSPYTGSEANLSRLYHLDGDGVDSTVAAPATKVIAANDAAWLYSPSNWLVSGSGAKTINCGAYAKILVTGGITSVNFTPSASPYARAKILVNKITVYDGVLNASSIPITLPADAASMPKKLIEVHIKGIAENVDRWNTQVARAIMTGITIDASGSVTLPTANDKSILCFGDSITEGSWGLGNPQTGAGDGSYFDGINSWATLLGRELGAEVGNIGFSGTSITANGSGNVPTFPTTVNLLWAGQARTFGTPDMVVVAHGHNDSGATDSAFSSGLTNAINTILAATPTTTTIVCLRSFNGTKWTATQSAVAALASPRVVAIDTTGIWDGASDSPDATHPYVYLNQSVIAPKVAALIRSYLARRRFTVVGQ